MTHSNLAGFSCWQRQPLLADAELLNDGFVALGVVGLQIIEQTAAFADKHKKPAPGGMIFLVSLEVLGQITDSLRQDRDLHFGAPSIVVVRAILRNDVLLLLLR